MILRTFAARCETALESRKCGLGYPEKLEKYTDFELSCPLLVKYKMALKISHNCTTRQCEFLGTHDCPHAVLFFEHRYFESESALVTIYEQRYL